VAGVAEVSRRSTSHRPWTRTPQRQEAASVVSAIRSASSRICGLTALKVREREWVGQCETHHLCNTVSGQTHEGMRGSFRLESAMLA
jgi:hypothetical protein